MYHVGSVLDVAFAVQRFQPRLFYCFGTTMMVSLGPVDGSAYLEMIASNVSNVIPDLFSSRTCRFPSWSFIFHLLFAGLASLSSCRTLVSSRVVLPLGACRKPDLGLINLTSQATARERASTSTSISNGTATHGSYKYYSAVRIQVVSVQHTISGGGDTLLGLSVHSLNYPFIQSISTMALHDPSLHHHNTPVSGYTLTGDDG